MSAPSESKLIVQSSSSAEASAASCYPFVCSIKWCDVRVLGPMQVVGGRTPCCFPVDHKLCIKHYAAVVGLDGTKRHACPNVNLDEHLKDE